MKHNINLSFLLFLMFFCQVSIFAADSLSGSSVWYGFEDSRAWSVNDWENNAMSNPLITGDFVSEGKKSLQVSINMIKAGHKGIVQVFDTGDMSGAGKISFDIYNSSDSTLITYLMLKTGQNWVYHESRRVEVKPGWNKGIIFDLTSSEFGSGGKYDGIIKEPDQVRRFGLLFESKGPVQGIIFFDNIRLTGTNLGKLLPAEDKQAVDEGKTVLIDSFEGGRLRWSAAGTWSCATTVENTTQTASEGKGAMKASYNLKGPGANAVFMIEDSLDLSDAIEMKVDVYYPDEFPSSLTLSLGTGDKWVWQEYTSTKIRKGWNKDVTFSFVDRKWKNEGSKWANTANPEDINAVKRVSLVLVPANIGEGHVIFDNVRIKTKAPDKLAGIMPFDMSGMAFYIWNSFEKGVNWTTQSDQSGAVSVQPAFDVGGENKKGMKVIFSTQSSVAKAAYLYRAREDFSKSVGIKFDVYNPMPYSVKVSIAFQVGDEEMWIESKPIGIGPGWNRSIFFDFISPSFKSAESNWNYSEYFTRRNDIRSMILQVYPDQKVEGSIFITDMMLARRNYFGEPGKMFGATLANNSWAKFETIKYAEWDNGEGSFENGPIDSTPAKWAGFDDTNAGVSYPRISGKYPSKGNKSLRIDYKAPTNNKFSIIFTQTGVLDVSPYTSMSFDVYNPGKPLKFTLAMQANDSTWYETRTQKIINPGWNKNVTVKLDENIWKTGAMNGPMKLGSKNDMKTMILSFFNGVEGAVYVDNFRWGVKSQAGITGAGVEQDINLESTPLEAIEAKVTLRASYYHDQKADLQVSSARLILRGFGNELALTVGESVKLFDDSFRLADPSAIGQNLMALTLGGTIYPINTSYLFSVLSLDSIERWKPGMSYIGTARIKTYFLDKNYVGGIFMHSRRGYAEGANILTGDIQQSSNIFGLDTALIIPVADIFNLNIKGEYLYSMYSDYLPIYELPGPVFKYATQVLFEDKGRSLKYLELSAQKGFLTAFASFRQIDNYFASEYCNPDTRAGMTNWLAQVSYIVDDVFPFSFIKGLSPEAVAFIRNTQINAQADLGISTSDNYSRKTYTLEIKNDASLALYNYHIWYKNNLEGNASLISSNNISGFTKILIGNMLTFRILGRVNNAWGTVPSGAGYESAAYTMLTGFVEGSLKIGRDFTLTGSYKGQSSKFEKHNNWYAKAEYNLFGAAALALSYGEQPLTGYWLEDNSNDTQDTYMVTFKGRF